MCKASPVEWTPQLREINYLSTCSNAPVCSEYQLPLCVRLCVAFCEIRVYCVQGLFFGECLNSDPESSLRSARNASVKIRKLFVKRQVNSSMHESESSSESIYFVGKCSWVVLEQNPVQDALPASAVHKDHTRVQSGVHEMLPVRYRSCLWTVR